MTTSPTIDRPTDRPRQASADLSGNQQPSAARTLHLGRFPVPADRAALAVLLVGTALLYLWGLGGSGWANSFYSAAAQAGSESWKALFFGASDAAGSITVDKTPLALWPMALSVKVFGLSSWSILVPQAIEGVAAVWLLHASVRRTTGSAAAGLLAGTVLALTPVAVLMFRFNNPDALLVLLLIGSVYATQRAVEATTEEGGRPKTWMAVGGALVGLAFLAKMLQAFLVLPPLALAYLLFARRPLLTRLGHLLIAFGAMLLAGGWWVTIVSLWPAGSRPYIGGSQHNSILELTLGYNGFGRLTGSETGSVGGGMGWGETGLLRMFTSDIGSQVAWLIPAAMVLGTGALWFARGDRRVLTGLVMWLGWGVVTGLTFSLMAGIFHPYYTVALAPAIAAVHRHRRPRPLAPPREPGGQRPAGGRDRVHRHLDLLAARADRLAAVAPVRRAGAGPGRRAGPVRAPAPAASRRRRRRRGRPRRGARRPHGLLAGHGGHPAHRLDPERRPGLGVHRLRRRPRRAAGRHPAARRP